MSLYMFQLNECKRQINGIKNPKYRKFNNLSEAQEFVKCWKDKVPSPNKLIKDEKLRNSSSTSNTNVARRGCIKNSDSEKVRADNFLSYKKEAENKDLDVKSLQEKVNNCEKKIDFYINGLSTIISGLKEVKNDFEQISNIWKYYNASQKEKSNKKLDSKPGSSREKSTGFDSDDGDLFRDESDLINDNVSQGVTIEDFDFSEFDLCETSLKRKRLSSEGNADAEETKKRDKKVSGTKGKKDLVPFITDEDDYVAVYTDGCCLSNGYLNAKAGIGIWFGENHPLNVSEPFKGDTPTNNNAEIQAARIAIEVALKANISKLKILTDSQFLINSATKWMPKWKLNNWIASTNKNVVNRQELEKLDKVMALLSVRWEKVSGHSGIQGNEAADRLANKGAALYV